MACRLNISLPSIRKRKDRVHMEVALHTAAEINNIFGHFVLPYSRGVLGHSAAAVDLQHSATLLWHLAELCWRSEQYGWSLQP